MYIYKSIVGSKFCIRSFLENNYISPSHLSPIARPWWFFHDLGKHFFYSKRDHKARRKINTFLSENIQPKLLTVFNHLLFSYRGFFCSFYLGCKLAEDEHTFKSREVNILFVIKCSKDSKVCHAPLELFFSWSTWHSLCKNKTKRL